MNNSQEVAVLDLDKDFEESVEIINSRRIIYLYCLKFWKFFK